MPRKRRVEKPRTRRLTWRDLWPLEKLHIWIGWSPEMTKNNPNGRMWLYGINRYEGWDTWEEFFSTWADVREEALADWAERRASSLTGAKADAARREAQLRKAEAEGETDFGIRHYRQLYEWAAGILAKEERREELGPFAEYVYQRVLEGEDPEDAADDYRSRTSGY